MKKPYIWLYKEKTNSSILFLAKKKYMLIDILRK